MSRNQILRDAVHGTVAGIVGTVVMDQAGTLLYRFEKPEKKKQEEAIRTESPYDTMARRISEDLLRIKLGDRDRTMLGQLLHWGYGAGWGALYGVLRNRAPVLRAGAGAPFGILFFLVGDEALNTFLKLTPPPQAYPIDAHVRGLVAHLVYAAVTEETIRALEAVNRVGENR